jgi:hypothetical protein
MPNAGMPKRRRCLPRWAKVCIGVVGFFVAVTVIPRLYIAYQLRREYAAIRKAGYPVTIEELEQWYNAQPIGENAADVYMQAFSKFVGTETEHGLFTPFAYHSKPVSPLVRGRIAWFVRKNSEALKLLHQAAMMPECRFPFPECPSLGEPQDDLLHRSWHRGLHLLYLEAVLAANDGDPDRTYAAADAFYGMAASLKAEPFLDSWIPWDLWANPVGGLLTRVQLTDAQLEALSRRLEQADDPARLTRSLIGLRCQGSAHIRNQPAFRRLYFGIAKGRLDKWLGGAYWLCGLRGQDELAFLRFMDQCIQWSTLPAPDRWETAKRASPFDRSGSTRFLLQPLTRQVLGTLRHSDTTFEYGMASLRGLRTLLAVERYRIANDALPDTLDALVPGHLDAIPLSPYDGQPLRYKRLEKGYVIYSVGLNKRDDDGGGDDPLFTVTR